MKTIKVNIASAPHNVYLGYAALSKLASTLKANGLNEKIAVVIDKNVEAIWGSKIKSALNQFKPDYIVLPPGEKSKSFSDLQMIVTFLLERNFNRNGTVIAIGGGVTGDITAFAASVYMRGINLVHIPTTLLAMVDSSVGGKTGVNLSGKKNIVGTFYQPKFIFTDTAFLRTLPEEEYYSGLGEGIKYAFLADDKAYDHLFKNFDKIWNRDALFLSSFIESCIKLKSAVVASDEKEGGLRKILNFGHTFAHAFEAASNFKIKHGEAVNIGIIAALHLSHRLQLLSTAQLKHYLQLPLMLKPHFNLNKLDKNELYRVMHYDKKNFRGEIKFVLTSGPGKTLIDTGAGKKDVIASINDTFKLLAG